jgi:uncharacterized membrane protein YdfJ with MMPL/SSD domain
VADGLAATAIFLDAAIVRMLLVPATTELLGRDSVIWCRSGCLEGARQSRSTGTPCCARVRSR